MNRRPWTKIFNGFGYLFSLTILQYGISYLIVIYLKNRLGFAEYGELGKLMAFSSFLQSFIFLGLNNYVDKALSLNVSLLDYLKVNSIIGLFIAPLAFFFFYKLKILDGFSTALIITHSYFFLLVGIFKNTYTFLKEFKKYFLQQTLVLLILVSLHILCFSIFDLKSKEYRVLILIIVDMLFVILSISYYLKWRISSLLSFPFKRYCKLFLRAFYYSFPLIIHSLVGFFYSHYDRVFISNVLGSEASGRYWYYLQLSLPILALAEVYVRFRIKDLYNLNENWKLKSKLFTITHLVFLIAVILFMFPYFFSNFIFCLIVGQLFNALYIIYNNVLMGLSRTKFILSSTILVVFIQLSIYYFGSLSSLYSFGLLFACLSFLRFVLCYFKTRLVLK